MTRIGLTGFELPPDDPLTLDEARQSLPPHEELTFVRDWLARHHPDVDDSLETEIFEYVKEKGP